MNKISCWNSKCKYYYEDGCDLAENNKWINLDEDGKCTNFKEGTHEGYMVCDKE